MAKSTSALPTREVGDAFIEMMDITTRLKDAAGKLGFGDELVAPIRDATGDALDRVSRRLECLAGCMAEDR